MPSVTNPTLERENLLTVAALAEKLGLCHRTVYRWVRADPVSGVTTALPSHKVGRRVFFLAEEVIAWLKTYGPAGTARMEEIAGGDAPIPSGKIRRARKARA